MPNVHILYIYADDCEHCQKALDNIESAVLKCREISCKIYKFMYDSKEAVTIAINNKINDLPGIVIGESVFIKECSEEEIIEAIKKASIEH